MSKQGERPTARESLRRLEQWHLLFRSSRLTVLTIVVRVTSASSGLFSSPDVQKILANLLQNGCGLLQNLSVLQWHRSILEDSAG